MWKVFVVSDIWFNRPFKDERSILEYNSELISIWNNTVSPDDIVYVLGGFGIGELYHIVRQLNGEIHFLNNYYTDDEKMFIEDLKNSITRSIDSTLLEKYFFESEQIMTLPEEDCVLSYFPLSEWYGKDTGTFMFHGMTDVSKLSSHKINCNIQYWDKQPISINDVKSSVLKFENV